MRKFLFAAVLLISIALISDAQTTKVKKVVLQGFWWDYWNSNFPNGWSNYLTELAPRLKSMGVDAIWIPPAYKNTSPSYVGYAPFDQYDLGDKFQKGSLKTRMGNKDELLRLVAVMHANGIEVIEDIVLNHNNNAGTSSGAGGQDPEPNYSMKNESGYKNFRYVSYSTPAINESQNDYWTRSGRWSKNYANFYPNKSNNCATGDICSNFFGPDISYESTATGQSSNIPKTGSVTVGTVNRTYVNATQSSNYMRDNARNWLMWLKKQTGVDGWRWDAVKHFPSYVQEDLIYNTKYILPPFAKGDEAMFNVGECVGNKTEIDNYVTAVRSGNEEHTGTFDFSLRGYGPNGGLYSMVLSQGNYNMQNLPAEQQTKRYYDYASQRVHRTVPFVNSHDTYRPILDASGNYTKPLGDASGWNVGSELGGNGGHIDPREPRFYAAYATIFSMDGNPIVFFEDIFDIGTTGKRYSHLPANTTDLPVREDVLNIIEAHQKLQFKNGDYAVPTALTGTQAPYYAKGSSADHLVFERLGRALIGVTDKFNSGATNLNDEEVWVSVGDASWNNRDLIDYSGAHGLTTTHVYPDGRVLIKTSPAGHTIPGARGHGYSIWAPIPTGISFSSVSDLYTYLASYSPNRNTSTVQEWEMANDLGDSNINSLQQGGKLPANSTAQRIVGRIFASANQSITYKLFPELNGTSQNIALYNTTGTIVSQVTGTSTNTAPLTGNYMPSADGWLTIKVKNSTTTSATQRVWVNVTYVAPAVVNTRTAPGSLRTMNFNFKTDEESHEQAYLSVYPNPTQNSLYFSFQNLNDSENLNFHLFDLSGRVIIDFETTLNDAEAKFNAKFKSINAGVYLLQVDAPSVHQQMKIIKL